MPREGFVRDNPFGLTDKQLAFLNEYLVDFNVRRAARVLGFGEHGCWNWARDDKRFQAAIDAYLEKRRQENEALVTMTLNELKAVMLSDIKDYADWKAGVITLKDADKIKNSKAIKSVEQTQNGLKVVLHDKVRSIELMMQGLGMMKKPAGDKIIEPPTQEEEGKGIGMLEALNRAHQERRGLPGLSGGMIAIEQSKSEEKTNGNK